MRATPKAGSSRPTIMSLVQAGLILAFSAQLASAAPETTDIAAMRELRVSCLEAFNTAKTRLADLNSFVNTQATRQREASDRLFRLQQDAASAKRRLSELQKKGAECKTSLEQAQFPLDQAIASYRAAAQTLPNGETWAAEGAKALSDLRKAADAAPRELWKQKRLREARSEFSAVLEQWRSARREFERAEFDLQLRAAPNAFKRAGDQIAASLQELNTLNTAIAEREKHLSTLAKDSEKWTKAIQGLHDSDASIRKKLAKIAYDFHLVDLKFAAWRLKQAGLAEDGMIFLPDDLERHTPAGLTPIPSPEKPLMIASPSSDDASAMSLLSGHHEASGDEEAVQQADDAFREILERVNIAQGRLKFLSELWQQEASGVESAIGHLESAEDQVRILTERTSSLAADSEALRRSSDALQQILSAGLDTLDLVQKRFSDDLSVIERLIADVTTRTTELDKKLK